MNPPRSLILFLLASYCAADTSGALMTLVSPDRAQEQEPEQRPGPPGTIRVRVRLIPIDVIVTKKGGKPVLDLRKEDFTVLENGHPQEIQHFSVQKLTPAVSPPEERLPLRRIPALELAPQSARTFLILLGRGEHRYLRTMDALIKFVRRDLLPQDRVAVFAYNRATDFTTDHEQAAQVLERYKDIHLRIEQWFRTKYSGDLAAVYGSTEIPPAYQSEIDKIFDVPGRLAFRTVPPARLSEEEKIDQHDRALAEQMLRVPPGSLTEQAKIAEDVRKAMDQLPSDWSRSAPGGVVRGGAAGSGRGLVGGFDDPFLRMEWRFITDLPFDEYLMTNVMTEQDLQNIFTAVAYMRYMEGEKRLLFFTENGLFLPRLESDKSIAAMANDARVAIDTFQTGGVKLDTTVADASLGATVTDGGYFSGAYSVPVNWSRSAALTSLRNISDLTGGRAAAHRDIGDALSSVNDATRAEYLLGYYPEYSTWDGKYRRITVKVSRPGLEVSYRHGYYARDALEPYNRQEFLAYSRISAAAEYPSNIADIPFKVSTEQLKNSAGDPQMRVVLSIDATKVRLEKVGDMFKGRLQIAVFNTGTRDKYLGDDWQTMDMDLREETYQRVMREGIPYSTLIPLRDARQSLKIVVYDCVGDKVGSAIK